jgi:hypothetical protein
VKGLSSIVVFLLSTVLVVAGIVILMTYSISQAELSQKQQLRATITTSSEKDYLQIDGFELSSVLTIHITALDGPIDMNDISVFVDHVFKGTCSTLSCLDQTNNGYLISGESGEINVPISSCRGVITLEYEGSTVSKPFDLCSWSCRRTITITSSFSDPSYPIRIELNTDNFDFSETDGNDLRFYDGNTELNYWIESWSGTNAVVWVSAPTVSGEKNIYMYYCNPYALSESNGYRVFLDFNFDDTSLLAVFHFDGTTDATGTYTITLEGNASFTTGRFGNGVNLDGNGDYVLTDYNEDINTLTYLIWAYSRTESGYPKIIYDGAWDRVLGTDSTPIPFVQFDSSNYYYATSNIGDAWHFLTIVVDGSSTSPHSDIYVDGVMENNGPITSVPSRAVPLCFGSECGSGDDFNGIIDEAILFGRILSQEEIASLYKGYFDHLGSVWVVRKRQDPEPSVSVGPEEKGSWSLT